MLRILCRRWTGIMAVWMSIGCLVLAGCSSKFNAIAPGGEKLARKSLVIPMKASDVIASSEFQCEYVTRTGIRCYVKFISPAIVPKLSEKDPAQCFLSGDDVRPFLVIPIKDERFVTPTEDEAFEIAGFVSQRSGRNR
jgi:hypothetical protein